MRCTSRWLVALLLLAGTTVSACGGSSQAQHAAQPPAKVEPVPGSHLKQVVLSAPAARRLGVRTARVKTVRKTPETGGHKRLMSVIPYAAVFYDSEGDAFTYTSPRPLTYVRRGIVVNDIERPHAFLLQGPPAGTAVVTVGAGELLGIESGVQE